MFIARRPMQAPPTKEGPRINDMIDEPTVLLIDAEGEKRGVIPTDEAIRMAGGAGGRCLRCATTMLVSLLCVVL